MLILRDSTRRLFLSSRIVTEGRAGPFPEHFPEKLVGRLTCILPLKYQSLLAHIENTM